MGLNGGVVFTGLRHDVPDLLNDIDILVMPSLWEGLPIIALEAMAAGLPIVAADVGGTKEAVINQKTGILIPARDVKALTQALRRLVQNKTLRREMGNNGRARALKHFSVTEMVKRHSSIYEEAIAS
jgi:glycosyltransferase involved in cell wall biosynthesis